MSVSVGARHELDYGWLRDDTEEDYVGADWHQNAIHALSSSLKMLAEARDWPWHVGDQFTVVGAKPDGTAWRPGPDVSVYPRLGRADRQDVDTRTEGAPALVIEVASASTWKYDVSLERVRHGKRQAGKAYGYLYLMRVHEYLVFDPHGEFLADQVRAWRRLGDEVEEWRPEAGGRFYSRSLDVSFRPDGPLLRTFGPDGAPVPYWFETGRELTTLQQEKEAQARRIAALEEELELLHRMRNGESS